MCQSHYDMHNAKLIVIFYLDNIIRGIPALAVKGIFHPKVSFFTIYSQVLNLYEFLSAVGHKTKYSEECQKKNSIHCIFCFYHVNQWLSLSILLYIFSCVQQMRNSNRIGGWVNDDNFLKNEGVNQGSHSKPNALTKKAKFPWSRSPEQAKRRIYL